MYFCERENDNWSRFKIGTDTHTQHTQNILILFERTAVSITSINVYDSK